MPTPGVEPRFYTLDDVATVLNVRVAQVYALVRSGELPAVKLPSVEIPRAVELPAVELPAVEVPIALPR